MKVWGRWNSKGKGPEAEVFMGNPDEWVQDGAIDTRSERS
jgi:hypothetical protein